ncbi:MAG: hypothetical protein ACYS91_17490 [Planctomycetota bacterium]
MKKTFGGVKKVGNSHRFTTHHTRTVRGPGLGCDNSLGPTTAWGRQQHDADNKPTPDNVGKRQGRKQANHHDTVYCVLRVLGWAWAWAWLATGSANKSHNEQTRKQTRAWRRLETVLIWASGLACWPCRVWCLRVFAQ